MPKVKPLITREKWETELLKEIGGAQLMTGKSWKQICSSAGIRYETFLAHLRNPSMLRFGEYHAFMKECERLGGIT